MRLKEIYSRLKEFGGKVGRFVEANGLVMFLLFCFFICLWIAVGNELNYRELEQSNRELKIANEALRPKCPCSCDLAP